MADHPAERFAALVAEGAPAPPLDEGLLLIAAHADPTLDLDQQQRRLDEVADAVAEPTVDAVRALLFDRLGFTGDRASYYDARNSLLPDVLDRRLGIPLSLAAVTIEVGRRCGVGFEGVGMPGHYLVRPAGDPSRFLDGFHDGRWLDRDGCAALFAELGSGVPWDERYLEPDDTRSMLARTLANLAGAYRRAGDRSGLCWALGLRLLLPGSTARDRRELGLLLGASGRFREGAEVLEASGEDRDHRAAARMRARLN